MSFKDKLLIVLVALVAMAVVLLPVLVSRMLNIDKMDPLEISKGIHL